MGFIELNNRIKQVNKTALIKKAIEMNTDLIADLNAKQMREGKNAKGSSIRPKYTEAYEKRKKKLGYSLDGTPNLLLSGDFQNEMDTVVSGADYFITSFNEVTQYLEARYTDIFGLTKENLKIAQLAVTTDFMKLYTIAIGL